MRYIISILASLLVGGFSLAQEAPAPNQNKSEQLTKKEVLKITLRYFAIDRLTSEVEVVIMGNKITKDARQLSLSSEERVDEEGNHYWIGTLVIEVTKEQLRKKFEELDKQKTNKKDSLDSKNVSLQ